MATKVFTVEKFELQDGTEIEVRPLNIKRLRKFMEVITEFSENEDEDKAVDLLVKATAICIEQSRPELAQDLDAMEEVFDTQTMWKVLEVAGGIKMNDPNPAAAGLLGRT